MSPNLAGDLEAWREGSTEDLYVELWRLWSREPRLVRLLWAVPPS